MTRFIFQEDYRRLIDAEMDEPTEELAMSVTVTTCPLEDTVDRHSQDPDAECEASSDYRSKPLQVEDLKSRQLDASAS